MWANEGLKVAFIKKLGAVLDLIADNYKGTKKTYCNPEWEMGPADYWPVMGSFECSNSGVT